MQFTPIADVKKWYSGLPDKKRWIDVVTALLTVPVLLTVIISNYLNIQTRSNGTAPPPPVATQAPVNVTITNQSASPSSQPAVTLAPSPTASPAAACNSQLPDVEIISPREGEIVGSDPVCVVHTTESGNFCPVSWAYRINGSVLSLYTTQPVCLFNMADGPVEYELTVRNESGQQQTYTRGFIYQRATPSPEPTPADE